MWCVIAVCVCPCVCLSGIQFHDQWVIHKHVMKKSNECSLFVSYDSSCVLFHVVTEVNHELCGAVRGLHGSCGR
jgi:hypothetical protein